MNRLSPMFNMLTVVVISFSESHRRRVAPEKPQPASGNQTACVAYQGFARTILRAR